MTPYSIKNLTSYTIKVISGDPHLNFDSSLIDPDIIVEEHERDSLISPTEELRLS